MKLPLKQIDLIIVLLFATIIMGNMALMKPVRYGEGNEYFLMLESINNHLSPDLQESDITSSYSGECNTFGGKADPYWGCGFE